MALNYRGIATGGYWSDSGGIDYRLIGTKGYWSSVTIGLGEARTFLFEAFFSMTRSIKSKF